MTASKILDGMKAAAAHARGEASAARVSVVPAVTAEKLASAILDASLKGDDTTAVAQAALDAHGAHLAAVFQAARSYVETVKVLSAGPKDRVMWAIREQPTRIRRLAAAVAAAEEISPKANQGSGLAPEAGRKGLGAE